MRFDKLVIENFSSFYGKHQIEFHSSVDKPLTIIIGGGGKGKTSIFDALNWALYGENYEPELLKEDQKRISDFVNETALYEAIDNNSSVEMAATLFFEHNNKHYRIQHAICVFVKANIVHITDRTASLKEIHETGNASDIFHIDSFLNEILPNNVRNYFLFNGDRINRLSLPGAGKEIREGIYRVVDLELLQNGILHLNETAKKFRKSAKEASTGDLAEIEDQYTQAFTEMDEYKRRISNLTDERRALDDSIDVLEDKLRGMEEVNRYQVKRDVLKEQLTQLSSTLKQTTIELRAAVAVAASSFALPEIESLMEKINTKRNKGEIPGDISEKLLSDILELHKCICGSVFSDGDAIYHNLTNRLSEAREKGRIGQELINLYFDLTSAKTEITRAKDRIFELEKRRSNTEKAFVSGEKEYKDILTKLEGAPAEEIAKLAAKVKEYSADLANVRMNLQIYQQKVSDKEELIKKINVRRVEMGEKQVKARRYQLRDNLAQRAADELSNLFETFAEESRLDIQKLTSTTFKNFIPTAEALSVGIDEEFHYDVRDQIGNQALQQLSQGQKQALSLAYITSISKVSEKDPPLVIDYPMGRMDSDVQNRISSKLPYLGSQIVLLMLPGTEWNEKTESILRPASSDIYWLEFDNKKRQSSIIRMN